jgi:hypothetical protein
MNIIGSIILLVVVHCFLHVFANNTEDNHHQQSSSNLLRFENPLNGTTLLTRWLDVMVVPTSIEHPIWRDNVSICLTIIRSEFFFQRHHEEERISNCWHHVTPESFPITVSKIDMTIKGEYSAVANVIAGEGGGAVPGVGGGGEGGDTPTILSTHTINFTYALAPSCMERVRTAGGVVRVKSYGGLAEHDPYNDIRVRNVSLLCPILFILLTFDTYVCFQYRLLSVQYFS